MKLLVLGLHLEMTHGCLQALLEADSTLCSPVPCLFYPTLAF